MDENVQHYLGWLTIKHNLISVPSEATDQQLDFEDSTVHFKTFFITYELLLLYH